VWDLPGQFPDIALSADGIFAYRTGKPWRFIGWREIVSITRCTWPLAMRGVSSTAVCRCRHSVDPTSIPREYVSALKPA
jgi:hypothetical protein